MMFSLNMMDYPISFLWQVVVAYRMLVSAP